MVHQYHFFFHLAQDIIDITLKSTRNMFDFFQDIFEQYKKKTCLLSSNPPNKNISCSVQNNSNLNSCRFILKYIYIYIHQDNTWQLMFIVTEQR